MTDEWKKTHQMTLPSGNVAELKRVALADLVATGGIPDTLAGLATELSTKNQLNGIDVEGLRQYVEVVNQVVVACMVEPRVSLAGGFGLNITDVDYVDRLQIFRWANGVAHTLQPFLEEAQARPAKPRPARKNLRG